MCMRDVFEKLVAYGVQMVCRDAEIKISSALFSAHDESDPSAGGPL